MLPLLLRGVPVRFPVLAWAAAVVAAASLLCPLRALAAGTWSGEAGDGLFSSSGNWDVSPVSGNTLTFTSLGASVYGGTITDDLLALTSVGGLAFNTSYTGPLTINASGGAALTLTGDVTSTSTSAVLDSTHFMNYNVLFNVPITIAATNRSFTSATSNATAIGPVTITGAGQITSNSTTSNGLFITGAYTGSGSDTVQSDGNRFTGGSTNGSLSSGFGGVIFMNGQSSNVANLKIGSANASNFAVEGKWNGSSYDTTTVHVTGSFKMYRDSNTASEINVANGGQLIVDPTATMGYSQTPIAGRNLRANLGGDGNANNVIEFGSTTVDLGAYFYPNGNSQARYGGTQVGGLNLITHGSTWTLYTSQGIDLNFNGADGGGWTVKSNSMTVRGVGTGGQPAGVTFTNSRFLDVAPGLSLTFDSTISGVSIAGGKTVTLQNTGTLNINTPINTLGTSGGTLAVANGTANINAASYTSLSVTGGTATTTVTGSVGTLGGLTVGNATTGSGTLILSPNSTAHTIWYVGGGVSILKGATLNYNIIGDTTYDQISATGALTLDGNPFSVYVTTGSYSLGTTSYTLIAGGTAPFGSLGTCSLYLNGTLDTADTLAVSGDNLVLNHATAVVPPSWKTDGNGNWTTDANWNNGPHPNAAGAEADFLTTSPNANAKVIAVDAPGLTVGTMKFDNAIRSYTIDTTSNALTLQASAGSASIQVLNGAHTISGTGGIMLNSDVDINVSGGATLNIQNVSGAGRSLTASGTGTLTFTGTNTYSGTSAFNGTVNIGDGATPTTLSGTTQITVSGTMVVKANAGNPFTARPDLIDNGTITLYDSAQFGTITGTATSLDVPYGKTLTIGRDGAADSTVSLSITGPNVTLVKEGNSRITLASQGNTQFTDVFVNGGTLVDGYIPNAQLGGIDAVRATNGITVGANGTFELGSTLGGGPTFSGSIHGAGGVRIGAGSPIGLGGTNTYTGPTTIDTGAVLGATPGANLPNSSSPVQGDYVVNGTLNLSLNAGTTNLQAKVHGTGSLTLSNNATLAVVQSIDVPSLVIGSTTTLSVSDASNQLPDSGTTITGGGTLVINQDISGTLLPAAKMSNLTKSGAGHVTLPHTGTSFSTCAIDAGTLQFALVHTMPAGVAVAVNGATLAVNVGGTNEFTAVTSGAGSIGGLLAGTGGQGGSVTWAAGSSLGLDTSNAPGPVSYTGAISTAGLGIVKLGGGTLSLGGNNTYTGGTIVTAGTLLLGSTSALGTGLLTASGGTVDLAGYSPTVGGLAGALGTITDNSTGPGPTILSVNQAGATAFGGTICDHPGGPHVALDLTGAGTLTLGGSNTYSGGTTISSGTLALGVNNALPLATALAVGPTAAATFDLHGFRQTVGSLSGSNSAAVTLGGGALSITGAATSNFLGTISNSINTAALVVGGVNPTTLSGNINGDLTLDKYDAGTLTLSGTGSTYTRDTNIWAGTVVVQSASALGGTSAGTYVRGAGGGVLQLANVAGGSVPEPITLYDGAQLQNTSGSNGVSGTITAGPTAAIVNTAAGTTLTISGNIVSNWTDGRGVTVGGAGNTTISGNIGGSSDPGNGLGWNITAGLVKSDTGTLTLSGTNSYTGGTTVSDGLLVINRSAALPGGSILTIGANGSVELGDSTLNGTAIPLGNSAPAATLAPEGVTADGVHAVPEPGTLVLLAAAACGFALRRKKGLGIRD
ncbi:MAG: autotransporter-associated beta strand repeat-containing protein [Thermoguttaceae bacterium]